MAALLAATLGRRIREQLAAQIPCRVVERRRTIRIAAHELAHDRRLAGGQFHGCSHGDNLAGRHQVAAMGNRGQFAHNMGNDDAGDAKGLVELLNEP